MTETITRGEETLDLTILIGLGEEQRRHYETLDKQGLLVGGLSDAYQLHQQSHEALIKYQRAFV